MKTESSLRVLVTAGASGIGRGIAAAFHRRGDRVHVCDMNPEALAVLRNELPEIGGTLADVSRAADVDRLFADAHGNLGGLDVLVNNAGIAGPTAPVEEVTPEEWERTLAVNLTGQFLCARLAVPLLKQAGGGAMINMASVAGRLGYPLRTPYAASKWGVIGLTESLAIELGPHNIRVNAILPGVVEGERMRGVISARADAQGVPYAEMEQQYLSQVSLRRMVTVDDIAAMALFLCSEGGRHITGQSLSVCGNVEVLR